MKIPPNFPSKFHYLDSYDIHENYELSKRSILLNELVSSDVSCDTEIMNLPPFKKRSNKLC